MLGRPWSHQGSFLLVVPGNGSVTRCDAGQAACQGMHCLLVHPLPPSFAVTSWLLRLRKAPKTLPIATLAAVVQACRCLPQRRTPPTLQNQALPIPPACRRLDHLRFLSIHPTAASLAATLGPAAAALNAAAGVMEAALGRHLFAFQLEEAALPACSTGAGPCAVWEASSGRVVLDATLAGRMAGREPPAASSSGRSSSLWLGRSTLRGVGTGGDGGTQADDAAGPALPALLAAFVEKLLEQAAGAAKLLQSGRVGWRAASTVCQLGHAVVHKCFPLRPTSQRCMLAAWAGRAVLPALLADPAAHPLWPVSAPRRPPCPRWPVSLLGRAPRRCC